MVKLAKRGQDNTQKGAEKMSKECNDCDELNLATLQNENADLKKKLDEATGQVKTLTDKAAELEKRIKEATDALNAYKEAEKKALIDSIVQRSEFKADELKDKPVEELRVIHLAIDKVKPPAGTVKNVRGAGDGAARNLTADGRIDTTKSVMGEPKRNADGSVTWVVD
jgi:phage shock protein A